MRQKHEVENMHTCILHHCLSYIRIQATRLLIHSWRLTWNIVMEVWKIIFLSKWVICRFHVNLAGCNHFIFPSIQCLPRLVSLVISRRSTARAAPCRRKQPLMNSWRYRCHWNAPKTSRNSVTKTDLGIFRGFWGYVSFNFIWSSQGCFLGWTLLEFKTFQDVSAVKLQFPPNRSLFPNLKMFIHSFIHSFIHHFLVVSSVLPVNASITTKVQNLEEHLCFGGIHINRPRWRHLQGVPRWPNSKSSCFKIIFQIGLWIWAWTFLIPFSETLADWWSNPCPCTPRTGSLLVPDLSHCNRVMDILNILFLLVRSNLGNACAWSLEQCNQTWDLWLIPVWLLCHSFFRSPEKLLHRFGLQMTTDFIDRNGLDERRFSVSLSWLEKYQCLIIFGGGFQKMISSKYYLLVLYICILYTAYNRQKSSKSMKWRFGLSRVAPLSSISRLLKSRRAWKTLSTSSRAAQFEWKFSFTTDPSCFVFGRVFQDWNSKKLESWRSLLELVL